MTVTGWHFYFEFKENGRLDKNAIQECLGEIFKDDVNKGCAR